jgi:adenylate cyclase
MAFEIERKFLVIGDDWRLIAGESAYIRQAYLSSHEKASIRVRILDDLKATLTVKSRGPSLRRHEFEYVIPVPDAEVMLALRSGAIIEKRRETVLDNGHTWEIDTFLGENDGLIIAEIELRSEDQSFSKPSWIGPEVTGQASYYNSALASRPFGRWTREDRQVAGLEP